MKKERDYLWDRSGPVDDEIAELEDLMSELKYARAMPPVEAPSSKKSQAPHQNPLSWLMVAAGFVLVCLSWISRGSIGAPTPMARLPIEPPKIGVTAKASWRVSVLRGTPTCDGATLDGSDGKLMVGGWLETRDGDEARVAIAEIGELKLGPKSKMKLVASDRDLQRIELAQGDIHAFVNAPPRMFLVDTPTATAVDLGCEYDLSVQEDGAVSLTVQTGWVALEPLKGNTATYVPAGFTARSHQRGVTLPRRVQAPTAFREAVTRYPAGGAIDAMLASAEPDDVPTLWHVLAYDPSARDRVYNKIAALSVPADHAARVIAGDGRALRRYGELLGVIPPPGWPDNVDNPPLDGDDDMPPDKPAPEWSPKDEPRDEPAPRDRLRKDPPSRKGVWGP